MNATTDTPNYYCVNCDHVAVPRDLIGGTYRCFAPANEAGNDLVTGEKLYLEPDCYKTRVRDHLCGVKAVWWLPKKELPPLPPLITNPDIRKAALDKLKALRTQPDNNLLDLL